MNEFVIYGLNGSPFMRSVEITLQEKATPYRLEIIAPAASKQPEYMARQPFGKIPAFQHGDFALYETQAIIRYINDVVPTPPLVPKGPQPSARMNQIIGINDCYFFPLVARAIVFHRLVGPVLGVPVDEAAIAAAVPEGRRCIGALDKLLGNHPFLAGDQFSLADVMLAPQLEQLVATPEGVSIMAGTRLNEWLGRIQERPSVANTRRAFKM